MGKLKIKMPLVDRLCPMAMDAALPYIGIFRHAGTPPASGFGRRPSIFCCAEMIFAG